MDRRGGQQPDYLATTTAHRRQQAPRTGIRSRWWLLAIVLLALPLLLYAALWSYRFAVNRFGPFAPLAAVLAVVVVLATVGPALAIRYRTPLRAVIVYSVTWLWHWVEDTGLLQGLARRFPRLARFLAARFTIGSATGLGLTVGLAVLVAIGQFFVDLLVEVVTGSPVVAIDRRILNLVATVRTPALDQAMFALSYLGNAPTVLLLVAIAVFVALLAGRYADVVMLVLAIGASEVFVFVIKAVIARPRPPLADARIIESGFGFPSGHATLAATFYATLAFLLARGLRHEWLKIITAVLAALVVLGVGISRIYLGVHYPSDVLAGWALGVFWLAVLIVAEHALKPATVASRRLMLPRVSAPVATVTAVSLLVLAVGYLGYTYRAIPPPPPPTPEVSTVIASDDVPATLEASLPHHSEGLTGKLQEPVSLVFVGTQTQVEQAFHAAGWIEAQPFGFQAVTGGILAALTHRGDPAGPVTPSFLAEEPNALAFSLPVGTTFAQRHHIRLWTTTVQTTDGQAVWLATASFDMGFELASTTFLPTHRIAPDIDTEREYVVTSLRAGGDVTRVQTLQLVPPEMGKNFDGDPYFTDGQAEVLWLQ